MPDPSHRPYKPMTIIRPNDKPRLWWLFPWSYALGLKRALDAVYLLSETTEDAYQAATTVIKQKQEMVDRQNKAIMDTANEAGFQESKTGYVINGEPISPFPLTWLGEAVAYWKGEAYSARKQRDEAKELADYHRNNLNTFQRKVELTLKPACPHLYEDTIGYVKWAADEIKALRASLSVITEDRDAYIEKLEKTKAELDAALERGKELQDKCRLIHGVHQGNVWIAGNHEERVNARLGEAPDLNAFRFGHMHVHQKPKAKRKPKRTVLAEDKTTGKKLLTPKKKAKYGDARDDYSAIGRRYLKHLALRQAHAKAIAKAKKKGGRRA